jgi:site-specific recombinase XerD
MVILDGMMQWLVQAGYIAANPMILQQVSRGGRKRLERFLTQSELSACLSLLDAQELKVARERWLFSVLAMAGLRISEVCTLRMSDFHVSRRDPGQWWLSVLGKGSKVRLVPVSDQLLDELQRFRRRLAREFGLRPALPPANETLPALPSLRDPEVFVTRSSLHTAVKSMCERLSATLLQNNPDLSTLVSSVSAHWLRHSYGTMLADNEVDLRVIMDNMGHSSIQSTQIYLHTQDRSRHEAVKEIEIKS